jgi:hypothetical protein
MSKVRVEQIRLRFAQYRSWSRTLLLQSGSLTATEDYRPGAVGFTVGGSGQLLWSPPTPKFSIRLSDDRIDAIPLDAERNAAPGTIIAAHMVSVS